MKSPDHRSHLINRGFKRVAEAPKHQAVSVKLSIHDILQVNQQQVDDFMQNITAEDGWTKLSFGHFDNLIDRNCWLVIVGRMGNSKRPRPLLLRYLEIGTPV